MAEAENGSRTSSIGDELGRRPMSERISPDIHEDSGQCHVPKAARSQMASVAEYATRMTSAARSLVGAPIAIEEKISDNTKYPTMKCRMFIFDFTEANISCGYLRDRP